MGNFFDFPLITTLDVIRCSIELQYFAYADGDWTDLMPPEIELRVKLIVRMFLKYNIKI